VYVTLDADAVRAADVPGVSAPNPVGLEGAEVAAWARLAGQSPAVASFDVVEINPRHDRDGQSARWAALVVWNFLVGLARRTTNPVGVTLRG
jgi:formiminoglutamase